MRAKLARSAQFEGEVTSPDDGDALIAGPGLDKTTQGATQIDKAPGLWKGRGEDIRVDRHNGKICLRTCRDDRTGDTMVNAQFVAEREVETSIQPGTQ